MDTVSAWCDDDDDDEDWTDSHGVDGCCMFWEEGCIGTQLYPLSHNSSQCFFQKDEQMCEKIILWVFK